MSQHNTRVGEPSATSFPETDLGMLCSALFTLSSNSNYILAREFTGVVVAPPGTLLLTSEIGTHQIT